jgi:Uma2 family endonuclease
MATTTLMDEIDIANEIEVDRLDDNLYEVVDGKRIRRLPTSGSLQKIGEYFQAGVQLVWVVYPQQRLVYVYETPTRVRILATDDTLDGGAVLPGFQLRVDSLFDTIAPAN